MPLLRVISCLLLSLIVHHANAQICTIEGQLLDSLNGHVVGATVLLSNSSDGSLTGFAFSDAQGRFSITTDSLGSYSLKVTYVGYGSFVQELSVTSFERISLGEIILNPRSYGLSGVEVEGRMRPIVIRHDTIEYNADAFHAGEGATVEDLLKQLPGVEVDRDGNIKAQGEEVKKVLVDGKEFFEDDPKVATRNIPAEVVDKVQVFDRPSEFGRFTGIDDGEEEKTINLEVKEGKNKGTFGELKSEVARDDRYNFGGNINRFNERMQLSLLANANSINERTFSIQDYLEFSGALSGIMEGEIDLSDVPMNLFRSQGISESGSVGINWNYTFGKKLDVQSNFFVDRTINSTVRDGEWSTLFADGEILSQGRSNESERFKDRRGKVLMTYRFSKDEDLSVRFRGGISEPDLGAVSNSVSIGNNTAVSAFGSQRATIGQTEQWNVKANYRKKFTKQGRFLTAELELSDEDRIGSGTILNRSGSDQVFTTILQQQESASAENGYSVQLDLVEPLGRSKHLHLRLDRDDGELNRQKLFYDGALISSASYNPALSNRFKRALTRNRAGLRLQSRKENWLYAAGLDIQHTELRNEDIFSESDFRSTYRNLLPNAMFRWKRNSVSRVQGRYSTRIAIPDMRQLQPVLDNSDPQNLYAGDPDLSPEYVHTIDLRYSNFNQFYGRSLFAGLGARIIDNAIAEVRSVDGDLVNFRMPVNSRTEWDGNLYCEYESPFKGKNIKYRIGGDVTIAQRNVLVDLVQDRSMEFGTTQTISLSNRKKKTWDWRIGLQGDLRLLDYARIDLPQRELFSFEPFVLLTLKMGERLSLDVDARDQRFVANDLFSATRRTLVDAKFTCRFLDDALNIHMRGINLLDETSLVDRALYASGYSDSYPLRLGRILLFGVAYRIRSFGK